MASGAPPGAAAAAPDALTAAAAPPGAASPALRADVERLASLLDDGGRRYLTRDWRPALEAVRAASGEVESLFVRLVALGDPAELLSVAAPLGATGFHWAVAFDLILPLDAFSAMADALRRAAEAVGAPEVILSSCAFAAGLAHCATANDFDLARPLLERALALRTRVLGATSREALDAQLMLGVCRYSQGAYAEAEGVLRAAYDGRKRLLGPGDASTLLTLQYLAACVGSTGNDRQAEALLGVALSGLDVALGPDHPLTLAALGSLAEFPLARGADAAAEPMLRRLLDSHIANYGEDDVETGASRHDLADCLLRLGRPAEAEPLYRQEAARLTREHGASHELTLEAIALLSSSLKGRAAEALELLRPALETATAALGWGNELT
jgi:hypothetical protein